MGVVGLVKGLKKTESVGEVTELRGKAGWGLMVRGLVVVVEVDEDLVSPLGEDWELARGL